MKTTNLGPSIPSKTSTGKPVAAPTSPPADNYTPPGTMIPPATNPKTQ